MKIADLEFPRPLLDALHKEKLVIFAGAGASMGDPANLPGFGKLASAIARGTGETKRRDETEDQFLGRLQHHHQNVHERAARVLSKGNPEPTGLHRDLIRIFSEPGYVRLVTTNFDTLFEAAEDQIGSKSKVYNAPALPLGNDFKGIVHLHGSICEPSRMVLTDADFGKAYLTEGWASRFLVELFASFSVLFVGYSHSDVVMKYLARSLTPSGTVTRFALTEGGQQETWRLLGIEPIEFQIDVEDKYRLLNEGVTGLADYANLDAFEWRTMINDIAKNQPPSNCEHEKIETVAEALSDLWRTRIFCEAASDPGWIAWLDEKKHLDRLFSTADDSLSSRDLRLSWWLAETFSKECTENLFLLIARHGMSLHPSLWVALGGTVASGGGRDIEPETLSRWVSVLLANVPNLPNDTVLPQLAERCAKVGLTDNLIDIYTAMAKPHLVLRESIELPDYKPAHRVWEQIRYRYSHHRLRVLWERELQPNLPQLVDALLVTTVEQLSSLHRMFRSWHSFEEEDLLSSSRLEIGTDGLLGYSEPCDVLIDITRDCLMHLAAERPDSATDWCNRLIDSRVPILRRLAIFTITHSDHSLPAVDSKIIWLVEKVGFYDGAASREIMEAMLAFYPGASDSTRQSVISSVMESQRNFTELSQEENEHQSAAVQFNVLRSLQNVDPDCGLLQQELDNIIERYPNFRQMPQQLPTDQFPISAPMFLGSPWSAEELLERSGDSWSDELSSYLCEQQSDILCDGVLDAVAEAAAKEWNWGFALANSLASSGNWESALWSHLLQSWSRELDESSHRDVLRLLGNCEIDPKHSKSLADMLLFLVKDCTAEYAPALLADLNRLAEMLWSGAAERPLPFELEEEDWLNRSKEHPAGTLSLYWVHSLSMWVEQQDTTPDSMAECYMSALSRIVQDETLAGKLGTTAIVSKVQRLMSSDESWVNDHLTPILMQPENAKYPFAWHGLVGTNFDLEVGVTLQAAYFDAVSHLNALFPVEGQLRNNFISAYTAMMIHIVDDPIESWMPRLFDNFQSTEDRLQFAFTVGGELAEMGHEQQNLWWKRWLKEYWENRLDGVPTTLKDGEVQKMLEWLPYFKEVFPEAVDCAVRMPLCSIEPDIVVYSLIESKLWATFPDETIRLLVYLADSESSSAWAWLEARTLVNDLRLLELSESSRSDLEKLTLVLGLGPDHTEDGN